jgi:K+/H+ antiporter YhaU regulatory subunit KhtT
MEMDELAAELAALKGNLAQRDQMETQRGFIDKYGSKFSGDEGIGVAILGELGRRGIDTSAADEAVQEILDNIRMEATAILDKIKGEQSAVSDLMDKMNTIEESIEAASGAMPDSAGAEVGMPPEGAPPPEPGMSPEMEGAMPPEEGMGGEMPPPEGGGEAPPPEEGAQPPEGEVSDRRMKYILSDEDLKEVFNAEDDDLDEIKAMLNAKRDEEERAHWEKYPDGDEEDILMNQENAGDFIDDEGYEYDEDAEGDGGEGSESLIGDGPFHDDGLNNLPGRSIREVDRELAARAASEDEDDDLEGVKAILEEEGDGEDPKGIDNTVGKNKQNHLVEALMGMLH